MLFAAVSRWSRCRPGSVNAALTSAWQSSNGAVDLERADVVAPARELVLLARRDLAFREQHADADAAAPVKGRRDGAAGVARRGDEDRQRARIAGASQRALHERRQEARADVLERGGRPVKQLEHRRARRRRRAAASAAAGNRTHRGKWRRARARGRSPAKNGASTSAEISASDSPRTAAGSNRGNSSGTNKPPSAARPRITASTRPAS